MSNFQYGLISRVDSNAMEECFDILMKESANETIKYLEIGLYNGRTASGVKEYLVCKNYPHEITGIDSFILGEKLVFFPEDAKLIEQAVYAGVLPVNLAKVLLEPDRASAIALAVKISHPGSMIAILGKGPDEYQIFGREKTFFSDRQEVLKSTNLN